MSSYCEYINCNCKYCEEGHCDFPIQGSGYPYDAPCFGYKEEDDEGEWIPGDVEDFPLETIVQLDANRIAAEMVHKAIDNTVWDEADYPGIKEKLQKVVDDWKRKQDEKVIEGVKHE